MSEDYRDLLYRLHHQASQDFDKTLLTIATGALALSVAFVDKIASPPIEGAGWIIAAWILFAGSILNVLASFQTSMEAIADYIDQLDAGDDLSKDTAPKRWTRRLNSFAAGSLVAGTVALVVFAAINLDKESLDNAGKTQTVSTATPKASPSAAPTRYTPTAVTPGPTHT
ncbi:MAG: hypothetical protein ACREXY_16795 [Gammaproteobacteria bacterium]